MGLVPIKIRKISTDDWYPLPVPVELSPSFNALDGDNSGRDNSTGTMFRDYITEKKKLSITFPEMDNVTTAEILNIIRIAEFQCHYPDTTTGQYEDKWFYCSGAEVNIEKLISETSWINQSFTVELVEM